MNNIFIIDMSIQYEPKKSASFEYVLNYSHDDFIYTHYPVPPDCTQLQQGHPCEKDKKSDACFQEQLCKNKELSKKALNIINTHHEALNRQYDEISIYERAIYNCLVMTGGIVAMGITMYTSYRINLSQPSI